LGLDYPEGGSIVVLFIEDIPPNLVRGTCYALGCKMLDLVECGIIEIEA